MKETRERHRDVVALIPVRLTVLSTLSILAALTILDVLDSDTLDYVGVYTALPFLVAIFAAPRHAIFVGVVALLTAYTHGVYRDVDDTTAQTVRLVAIFIALVIAALSSHLRMERQKRIIAVTDVSETAQKALLRPVPEYVGGLECKVSYTSAVEEALVGGDLYEVLDTPWGVRALLGDVRGKGLDAVLTANDVLGAFRHLAYTQESLETIIEGLDGAAARSGGIEDFVTAVLVEIKDGDLKVLNCGHPPPIIVKRSGSKMIEPSKDSLPLGLGADPDVTHVPFKEGDTLLLYTDGLSEARDAEGNFYPLPAGAAVLAAGPLAGIPALTTLLHSYVGGSLGDDVAMLALSPRSHEV